MKLRVKYSAQLRAALPRAEEEIELPAESRLSELLLHLADRHHSGRPHLVNESGEARASLLMVVNELAVSAADASTVRLCEGDIVWLLPPIAGG